MEEIMRYTPILFIIFAFGLNSVAAQEAVLTIEHAWARPTAAANAAAYLTIGNAGTVDDILTAVNCTPIAICMVHQTVDDNGRMSMHKLDSVTVAAGAHVEFRPGGRHIMLMSLKNPLVAGTSFPITLHFEKAGDVTVTVAVGQGGH
jgi:copper(I)-binding protein